MMTEKLEYDPLLIEIADYVHDISITSDLAYQTAHWALFDSLACLLLALNEPKCHALLGPWIPGTKVPLGSRVPGTNYELDPIKAAFDIGTCIRWLDYNDTWLAAEWAHPSDNLGGVLAIADFLSRELSVARKTNASSKSNSIIFNPAKNEIKKITMQDVLSMMIKAYEIQGILALNNAFNRVGLDHVLLVKVATAAVVSKCLGLSKKQTLDALSNVWIDNASLRTYRHAPNTGSRKSWAAGDATSRGLALTWMVMRGEQGYPSALSAKQWGFEDALFRSQKITLARPLQSYVMENILFKVAFPAEFHAQTAVEVAMQLYSKVKDRWDEIEKVELTTQEPAIRIIHKEGPLKNYADRDHCLQYMVAVGLLYGEIKPEHYSDTIAKNPDLDRLREKMIVTEDKSFSQDYYDPDKRAIGNAIQVFFKDGSKTECLRMDYPLGHKRRRNEALSLLKEKFYAAVKTRYSGKKAEKLEAFWEMPEKLREMPVNEFIDFFI